ncbi:MAG: UbiX family flavin prenyltransferase [Gammaproteobacteria bacterium]|nr:UbiX family flavin prenyltransferase [Gammaproteobacteria bacterium]
MNNKRITLAITGASGAAYSLRLLECLLSAGKEVALLISAPGQIVIGMEMADKLPGRPAAIQEVLSERYGADAGQLQVYGQQEWTASVASGSGVSDAMVVCPCTMGSLSAIACGASNNLLERAADVTIKENKKLILVPRETPFSAIHLENMLKLARLGVVILPANPGFYHAPASMQDLVDFVVARILDQLGVEHQLMDAWG